jgi:hypothetical protein
MIWYCRANDILNEYVCYDYFQYHEEWWEMFEIVLCLRHDFELMIELWFHNMLERMRKEYDAKVTHMYDSMIMMRMKCD